MNQFYRWLQDQGNFKRVVFVGILVRLLLLITDGHNSDFDFFEHWADRMVQHGLVHIYDIKVDRFECDYPPLYLYIIAPIAHLFDFFQWDIHTHAFDNCLKLFNLLVEIIFLAWFYQRSKNSLFVLLMIISPVSILNAYGWGQIDILYSILIFCSWYLLQQHKAFEAAIFLGTSMALKTQTLLFLPMLGLLWLLMKQKWTIKLSAFLIFLVWYMALNLPFILSANDPWVSFYPHFSAAGRYNNITVNAFNLYWTFFADFQLKMQLKFPANDVMILPFMSRKVLAYLLFSISFIYILWQLIKHNGHQLKSALLFSFFCFSFFMLLPEMHERYLFPMFIFSAYVSSQDPSEFKYFLIAAILHSMNLLWGWGEQKYIKDQWIFEMSRLISLATTATYIFYTLAVAKRLKSDVY